MRERERDSKQQHLFSLLISNFEKKKQTKKNIRAANMTEHFFHIIGPNRNFNNVSYFKITIKLRNFYKVS